MKFKIFISSVQSEFADERRRLADYIRQDALLGRFFVPFLFEESPACDVSAQQVYLDEVKNCDLYMCLLGRSFGHEISPGLSATECEYDLATKLGKTRLAFLKEVAQRESNEQRFVEKVQNAVTRKSFSDFEGLQLAVYGALIRHLEQSGFVRVTPFDASFDTGLTIDDVDPSKVDLYYQKAREAKKITIPDNADVRWILEKLEAVSDDGRITNAAVLLFAKDPQRKFIASEVKCLQYWGNEVERPIPSYRIMHGGLVDMIEDALAFVMSRIDHEVGEPKNGGAAPGRDELPYLAVREAIVNAVCHRDYEDNGSVQVMLFKNRLEIINPGTLPKGWTVEKLLGTHESKARNLMIARALNWAGYVEKSGNGTESIIKRCTAIGLQEPEYHPDNVDFKAIMWRRDKGQEAGEEYGRDQVGTKSGPSRDQVGAKSVPSRNGMINIRERIIELCKSERSAAELRQELSISNHTKFKAKWLDPLLEDGLIEYTVPDKPKSRLQKYRQTEKGLSLLEAHGLQ